MAAGTSPEDVIKAWRDDRLAYTGNILSDGKWLFSYALCIGVTDPDGQKVVVIPDGKHSVTTTGHVNAALKLVPVSIRIAGHANFGGVNIRSGCDGICNHVSYPDGFVARITGREVVAQATSPLELIHKYASLFAQNVYDEVYSSETLVNADNFFAEARQTLAAYAPDLNDDLQEELNHLEQEYTN